MIKKFLFPENTQDKTLSAAILILRIVFGVMLITHGWGKMVNFGAVSEQFYGGSFGLGLCVFAEVFCALGIVVGMFYRLALIPLIINMAVAFFVAHKAVLFGEGNGEMAFLYLTVFVALFIAGSGRYVIDNRCCKVKE